MPEPEIAPDQALETTIRTLLDRADPEMVTRLLLGRLRTETVGQQLEALATLYNDPQTLVSVLVKHASHEAIAKELLPYLMDVKAFAERLSVASREKGVQKDVSMAGIARTAERYGISPIAQLNGGRVYLASDVEKVAERYNPHLGRTNEGKTRTALEAGLKGNRQSRMPASPVMRVEASQDSGREEIAEIRRLFAQIRHDRPADLRDRTMLYLLFATGFSIMEVLSLNQEDIDEEHHTIIKMDTAVPVSEEVIQALQSYLRDGRPNLSPQEDEIALFLSNKGTRLTKQGFSQNFNKYVQKAYLPEGYSIPGLRRSLEPWSTYAEQ